MTPRLMLAAPASGSGKTTVTCALLQLLLNRGEKPVAFKSGPDYIDPMFHSRVIGTVSRNLDLFLMGETAVLDSLRENTPEDGVAVLEGAMGYYDGISMSENASAFDLARRTDTPSVLILDGRGSALSAAALAGGFQKFRPESCIAGVILNRISPMLYPGIKECIQRETGLEVYGFLPELPDCTMPGGRLGLSIGRWDELKEKLAVLAQKAEMTLDVDGLLNLARSAAPLPGSEQVLPAPVEGTPRIAVARDQAFSFCYADAMHLLEKLGAEIVEFSPLEDRKLPEHSCGLVLGGGSPEKYAAQLGANGGMLASIRNAIADGMPTIAEGGGFLLLHRTLAGIPMTGTVPADAFDGNKLSRFGYVNLTSRTDGLLCRAGDVIPAHEFHYWDSPAPGSDFRARKPQSDRGWDCCVHTETLYAGFPQIHLCGCPQAAHRFVSAAAAFGGRMAQK